MAKKKEKKKEDPQAKAKANAKAERKFARRARRLTNRVLRRLRQLDSEMKRVPKFEGEVNPVFAGLTTTVSSVTEQLEKTATTLKNLKVKKSKKG